MTRRAWLAGLALLLASPFVAAQPSVQALLVERAQTLLAALTESQREEATWPFDDDERLDIHYAPLFLDGVALRDLSAEQVEQVHELLGAALSDRGMASVEEIRGLEDAVLRKDGPLRRLLTGSIRDRDRYFLAIFGDPDTASPWAFRFEGHHLSLNVTSVPGAPPATTPLFLGAEPRRVPEGWPSAGVAALGEEEQLARTLVASLDPDQRSQVMLPYEGGRGLVLGEVRRVASAPSAGLRRADMTMEQQALVDGLLDAFIDRWSAPIAAARRSEIAAERDAVRFAWAEAADPANVFYARVQGPAFLIEIDNTTDGDHVHAVWHELRGDFGDDLLARHLAQYHSLARSD